MQNFKPFAAAVAKQWDLMSQHELFRLDIDGNTVWEAYLAAFPEGTNPIFRKRPEHDGSYDRATIRRIGNVVSLDGKTIWDAPDLEYPYDVVTATIAELLHGRQITGIFRASKRETMIGRISSPEALPGGGVHTWNHFYASVADRHRVESPTEAMGEAATTVAVMRRGLAEIKPEALSAILEMIDGNVLYRGAEFRPAVAEFRKLQRRGGDPWRNVASPVARFRNTVIGTLAVDLSDGVDEDAAVAAFEKKVAPDNYKRPTALITKGMVDQALKTIQSLDLEPALDRRYARLSDVSVNDILWVSNTAKAKLRDGVAALLADAVVARPAKTDPEAITVDKFLADVLPKSQTCEALVEGRHRKNLVSITAPQHADATPLFKWGNGFAWSYNGEITDAIKERVKKAGGNIHADLRVSLSWSNFDDLDLHCEGPYGHVSFREKMGILDVDMNAGGGRTRSPVENLAFMRPRDGQYRIWVNQYAAREKDNVGFAVEIECNGKTEQFTYPVAVRGDVEVCVLDMKSGAIASLTAGKAVRRQGISESIWGIQTETFVPVATIMASPNHWGGREIGNRHTFFLLEGCANPEPTRGIYNEFLRGDLEQHRKVFEVLGAKTKCPAAAEQLSGLGFSSTVRESVTVRAIGQTINKLYEVKF